MDESDLPEEGLQFPDTSSLRGTAWQDVTSQALLPASSARQLLREQRRDGGFHSHVLVIHSASKYVEQEDQTLQMCLLRHVRIAESEPYCHSILFVCLSVIPRPTAYHD